MFLAWWVKPVEQIPTGWAVCDGENGTPDLAGKFVRGAYSDTTRPPGTTGGSLTHTHPETTSTAHTHTTANHTHSHSLTSGTTWATGDQTHGFSSATHNHGTTDSQGHTHTSESAAHTPPYYEAVVIALLSGEAPDEMPPGAIAMWSGAVEDIPSGWAFCDGGGDRPDLRDRFLKGATEAGAVGGAGEHGHGLTEEGHHYHDSTSLIWNHGHGATGYPTTGALQLYASLRIQDYGTGHSHILVSTDAHDHDGLPDANHLPPFFALAFIIKEAE